MCDLCRFSAPHKGSDVLHFEMLPLPNLGWLSELQSALFLAYPNSHFLFGWFALFRRKGEEKGRKEEKKGGKEEGRKED